MPRPCSASIASRALSFMVSARAMTPAALPSTARTMLVLPCPARRSAASSNESSSSPSPPTNPGTPRASLLPSTVAILPIMATVEGRKLALGNPGFVGGLGLEDDSFEEAAERLAGQGKTSMVLAVDGKAAGVIALADTIKESARDAIEALHGLGMEVYMITGDNERTARAIADAAGIDHVLAEVLPQDKAAKVSSLQAEGKVVAMVGDGINDAPALVQADLGIAIGAGTDIAIEASDITLIRDDLGAVVDAIKLSRKTFSIIKQSLFFSFFYNSCGIPIAALGLLNPMYAAAAMALSSVSVVTNSLRLRRTKL